MDYSQIDDLQLLQQFKEGDQLAYKELFNRYNRFLKITAYNQLKDTQLAEEAINDVFISIWLRQVDIEINPPVKHYLYKAVRNCCARKYKRLKVQRKIVEYVDIIEKEFSFIPSALENKELGNKIDEAIANISSPSSRKAFEMQFLDQKPQREIAQEMNLSLDAVKKKINRAAQEVRQSLKKNE